MLLRDKRNKAITDIIKVLRDNDVDLRTVDSKTVHSIVIRLRIAYEKSPYIGNKDVRQFRDYLFMMSRNELDLITNHIQDKSLQRFQQEQIVNEDDRRVIARAVPQLIKLIG